MTLVTFPDCCPRADLIVEVVGHEPAAVTLAVHGEIDMDNADHLTHVLMAALAASRSRVTVHMAGVTFLGSSGIRALLTAQAQATAVDRRLVLREPQPVVHRVLELTGLLEVFDLPARTAGARRRRMVDALFERPA